MSDLKVYEVVQSYTTQEVYHVKASSEEGALEQFKLGKRRYINPYESDYEPPQLIQIEGPWESIEEYEDEYGAFEL